MLPTSSSVAFSKLLFFHLLHVEVNLLNPTGHVMHQQV